VAGEDDVIEIEGAVVETSRNTGFVEFDTRSSSILRRRAGCTKGFALRRSEIIYRDR
jgi:hypothetical protein